MNPLRNLSPLFFMLVLARPLAALTPVQHYHDLVAGRGDRGFRDGPFSEALFDRPRGLALDATGRKLFVADTGNRRIRVVLLDEQNRVETLAGSDVLSQADGPALQAGFMAPSALAWLGKDRLAVADGNALRLLDLAKKEVTTVVPDPSDVELQGIWNLLPLPGTDTLIFTQPALGRVGKLDLASGHVAMLVERAAELPQPAALALLNGAVLVSDLASGKVYTLNSERAGSPQQPTVAGLGRAVGLVGLAVSAARPFFVRAGVDSWGRLAPDEPVRLMTAWGELFGNPSGAAQSSMNPLFRLAPDAAAGFVADPNEERHFFLAASDANRILSLRDYHFEEAIDAASFQRDGLCEFDYPTAKPPNTVRILIVGDSHTYYDAPGFGIRHTLTRMDTFPKRLELLLAMDSALDDSSVHYQVFNLNQLVRERLLVWPYYKVPNIVQTYHIDLVLLVLTAELSLRPYFEAPLTKLGIPALEGDPEYVLKPDEEKLTDPALRRLFAAAKARGLAQVQDNGRIGFAPFENLVPYAEIRDELAELIGRPFKLLTQALAAGPGPAAQLYVVYLPFLELEPVEPFGRILADSAKQDGVKVLDLTSTMVALRTTFYGYNELFGNYHLNVTGHDLVAQILARQVRRLVSEGQVTAGREPLPISSVAH